MNANNLKISFFILKELKFWLKKCLTNKKIRKKKVFNLKTEAISFLR